jgi:hypothetical protein
VGWGESGLVETLLEGEFAYVCDLVPRLRTPLPIHGPERQRLKTQKNANETNERIVNHRVQMRKRDIGDKSHQRLKQAVKGMLSMCRSTHVTNGEIPLTQSRKTRGRYRTAEDGSQTQIVDGECKWWKVASKATSNGVNTVESSMSTRSKRKG